MILCPTVCDSTLKILAFWTVCQTKPCCCFFNHFRYFFKMNMYLFMYDPKQSIRYFQIQMALRCFVTFFTHASPVRDKAKGIYLFNTFYSLGFNEVRRKEKQACEGVCSRAGGSVRPRVKLNANMLTGNTLMCIRYNFSLVYRVNVIKSCQLALNTDYSRGSWECHECCKYLIITQSVGLIN